MNGGTRFAAIGWVHVMSCLHNFQRGQSAAWQKPDSLTDETRRDTVPIPWHC